MSAESRARLSAEQHALLETLLKEAPAPPGFDERELQVTRNSLRAKHDLQHRRLQQYGAAQIDTTSFRFPALSRALRRFARNIASYFR
jgi:hypothetical protein